MRQSDYRFTRRDVREASGWGLTQLKVHLKRLEELEYLLPHIGKRGRSYVYELAYEGAGDDGAPFMMGLIDVARLTKTGAETCNYDKKKSGIKAELSALGAELAGRGRPQVGGMSGPSRGSETCESAASLSTCADDGEFDPKTAQGRGKNPPASYANGVVSAA
jgi:hypothetical protein